MTFKSGHFRKFGSRLALYRVILKPLESLNFLMPWGHSEGEGSNIGSLLAPQSNQ